MNKIKAVLSDGGNVLFDDSFNTNAQIESLRILLRNSGRELTFDEIYSSFLPYKSKAQTIISEEGAINQFLYDNGCLAKFSDYESIKKLMKSVNRKRQLFEGVTETLEILKRMYIDFYILTDSTKSGTELQEDLNRMLIAQLQERRVYDSETFASSNYVSAIISSKDLGVKKPASAFFDTALTLGRYIPLKRNETVFVAHASDEILGAADLGIPVIAFNYQREKDAQDIDTRIYEHNRKYRTEQTTSEIYIIEKFTDVLNVVTNLNQ